MSDMLFAVASSGNSLPQLRRHSAGHYVTRDGRWKVFRQHPGSSLWQINAMTSQDAAWLRCAGLVQARFPARAAALRALNAAVETAPDLPEAAPDVAEKLRPLERVEGGWAVADGCAIISRPGLTSRWHGRRQHWVIKPVPGAPAADLLHRNGIGTRVFRRLDDAVSALAAILDDRELIDEINQLVAARHSARLRGARRWYEQTGQTVETSPAPAPLVPLSER